MTFNNPDRPASGWNTAVYNGQFSREGIAASMTPEERRAMIQRYEDKHKEGNGVELNGFNNRTTEFGGVFGPNIFGQAQKGINSLKSKFGKGKKGDNEITEVGSSTGTLGKDASSDENDSDTLADKQDEVVTVKATPA